MANDLRILMIADELEKQAMDANVTDDSIWQKMAISKRTFYRAKPKALEEVAKRAEIKRLALNSTITKETIEEAKNGLKTDLEIEMQLCRIAFGELDIIETTSTPDGLIDFHRKPTPSEMIQAMKEIWKKRGTYAPDKLESNIAQYQVTLNLK